MSKIKRAVLYGPQKLPVPSRPSFFVPPNTSFEPVEEPEPDIETTAEETPTVGETDPPETEAGLEEPETKEDLPADDPQDEDPGEDEESEKGDDLSPAAGPDSTPNSVILIPIEKIVPFPDHPFRVVNDEEMDELVESVSRVGILNPVLVRKVNREYQIISGHRRKHAAEIVGLSEIPCTVLDLTDDEAAISMVDSNLQREKILPSEKAFAYQMKLDAMRRQAGRPSKENSVPVGQNFGQTSREVLANNSPDSNTQIQRYIRLTHLIPELLDAVDEGALPMRQGVELSYIPEDGQKLLMDYISTVKRWPTMPQAEKLRQCAAEGVLNSTVIAMAMKEEKPEKKKIFKLPQERIDRFFLPGTSVQDMEETIVLALEMYRKSTPLK